MALLVPSHKKALVLAELRDKVWTFRTPRTFLDLLARSWHISPTHNVCTTLSPVIRQGQPLVWTTSLWKLFDSFLILSNTSSSPIVISVFSTAWHLTVIELVKSLWLICYRIMIYEGYNKCSRSPSSYRPISLANSVYKLYGDMPHSFIYCLSRAATLSNRGNICIVVQSLFINSSVLFTPSHWNLGMPLHCSPHLFLDWPQACDSNGHYSIWHLWALH